jgi:hypothetical protein
MCSALFRRHGHDRASLSRERQVGGIYGIALFQAVHLVSERNPTSGHAPHDRLRRRRDIGSGQSGAFCGLPSTFLSVCHLLLPVLTRTVVYAQTSPAVRQHVAAYGNQFCGLHHSHISRNTSLFRSLDSIGGPG